MEGTTGLLHPAGKEGVTPLAKNIVTLSTHTEQRLTMGRKGYDRVRRDSWNTIWLTELRWS